MNAPPTPPLTDERFRALLEAYGSRLARWPEGERNAAQALLAKSAEAARWLAEHRDLDAWLDSANVVEPSAGLLRKIAEIPVRHPRGHWWSRLSGRNAVAALGAAAALGLLTGIVTPERWLDDVENVSDDDDEAMSWNVDSSDEVEP